MEAKNLAAGPVVKPKGHLPHRIVLRAFYGDNGLPYEFVVHHQVFNLDGTHSFSDGNYFPVADSTSPAEVMDRFEIAYECWRERDRQKVAGSHYDALFPPV